MACQGNQPADRGPEDETKPMEDRSGAIHLGRDLLEELETPIEGSHGRPQLEQLPAISLQGGWRG
jgi:hypothetical protein